MRKVFASGLVSVLLVGGCATTATSKKTRGASEASATAGQCSGKPLTVHFYDVAQGLAALVDLPDGRHVLVDTGDQATRAFCGAPCKTASAHLLQALAADLHGAPISLLWVTHQHSDHIGGVQALIAAAIPVEVYADNGREGEKTMKVVVDNSRAAAADHGAKVTVVDPDHRTVPIPSSDEVTLTAIVPSAWPSQCDADPNDCSIGLRIDYCDSSILFTGDAEVDEEAVLETKPITLLQVGHHGSDTSTSAPFLAKVAPKYAVISAGKPGEGMNRTYCHPRSVTVEALTTEIGGGASKTVTAFDGSVSCKTPDSGDHWIAVPGSNSLWVTARDGDVVLTTSGDGVFTRHK
jgi:competence protein ComEC